MDHVLLTLNVLLHAYISAGGFNVDNNTDTNIADIMITLTDRPRIQIGVILFGVRRFLYCTICVVMFTELLVMTMSH